MTHPGGSNDPSADRTDIPPADPSQSYHSSDRLFTVKDAGEILGISPEAVRARLKRGTLPRETGEDGTVYVRLDAVPPGNGHDGTGDRMGGGSSDRNGGTNGWTGDGTGAGEGQGGGERIDDLREEVAFLREELSKEREARVEEKRRHDTIVLQLAQRIPELEPPRDERGRSEPVSEGGGNSDDTFRGSQESVERRSWLHRFFFGP